MSLTHEHIAVLIDKRKQRTRRKAKIARAICYIFFVFAWVLIGTAMIAFARGVNFKGAVIMAFVLLTVSAGAGHKGGVWKEGKR